MKAIGKRHPIFQASKWKGRWSLVQCPAAVITLLFCLLHATVSGASGPVIALDRKDHDFGDVQVGHIVQVRVLVSNKGNTSLLINEVRTSCGCTKAESADKEIPPGEKSEIAISYDSARLSSGRKTQSVFIHSNDPQNPLSKIQIFANIVHPISINPSSLIVRLPRFQEHVSLPVTAKNTSQQPAVLSVSSFEGAIHGVSLHPENLTIAPGSEVRFRIETDINRPEKGNTVIGEVVIGTDLPNTSRIKLKCVIKIDQVE